MYFNSHVMIPKVYKKCIDTNESENLLNINWTKHIHCGSFKKLN